MRRFVFAALLAACSSDSQSGTSEPDFAAPGDPHITHAISSQDAVPMPALGQPPAGVTFFDPAFGSRLTRITDARHFDPEPRPGLFPLYSKREAWNADETRLLLASDDGRTLLFDGRTYEYRATLDGVGGDDVMWHPSNPNLVLWTGDADEVPALFAEDVTNSHRQELFRFEGYEFANTRGEGNLSADGRSFAVVEASTDPESGDTRFQRLLLLSIDGDATALHATEVAHLDLPPTLDGFDWVSVSPSGNYVVVDYATTSDGPFQGVEVYDRHFRRKWHKPLGAGHSDLGVDAAGKEFLVMDVYDPDTDRTVYKRFDLANGHETVLFDLDPSFDQHVSCRNQRLTDWCFVSTFDYIARLEDDEDDWLPFEDEIFALKVDGSHAVRRLAHHHSRRYSPDTPDADTSVYYAEPHATVSRSATRVLFGSNWRHDVDQVDAVDAYVADISRIFADDR
jgi:hypothetical protein